MDVKYYFLITKYIIIKRMNQLKGEKMYKLLLVDDESTMRKRIIEAVKWHEYGFEILADAENGIDALEKVEAHRPDVVITDIKMPFLDGIELSKLIVKKFPLTKIIILTGFEDFKYAKEAINLKVLDYILKPVTKQNLIEVLIKTKDMLDTEIEEKNDITRLRDYYEQSLPLMTNKVLQQVVRGKVPKNQLEDILAYYHVDIVAKKYQATIISPRENGGDISYKNLEQYLSLTEEFIRTEIDDENIGISFLISDYVSVIFFDKTDQPNFSDKVESVLYVISDYVEKYMKFCVKIGVGNLYKSIDDISQSYLEARDALDYAVSDKKNEIIYFGDMIQNDSVSLNKIEFNESRIVRGIKTGSKAELRQEIELLFKAFENSSNKNQDFTFIILELVLLFRKTSNKINKDNEDGFSQDVFLRYLQENKSLDYIKQQVLKMSDVIVQNVVDERINNNNRIINKVKDYIATNYSDVTINVESVCNLVYITPNYFSSIFKKVTNESFTNYLTSVRLERAKELLKTTDLKGFEVASEVGFSDPNYFSYCFKKNIGLSPSQYRKS